MVSETPPQLMTSETPPPRGLKRSLSTPDKADEEVKRKPVSIVLTGGPCGGKSSILAVIRDRLRKRGMQVIAVPEYATHFFANSDGFQPEWVGTEKEQGLQNVFLAYQVMQEDMFAEFAALNSKPSVLLLDRAALDQKAHTSEEVWQGALRKNSFTERQLLDRYDLVVHLGTCAKVGEYEWGPESNNPGRYHNEEEASKLDGVTEAAYQGHKQFRLVPHFEKFQDKVEQVMKYLEDALGVDGLAGKRRRTSVRLAGNSIPAEVISQGQAFEVTTTYLDEAMELSVQRRRRVPVTSWLAMMKGVDPTAAKLPVSSSHVDQTFEERRSIPADNFLARRVVTEDVYHNEVKLARHEGVIKHVLTFQSGCGQHYELFYFQNQETLEAILDFTVGAEFPKWLEAGEEADKPQRKLSRHSTAEAAEAQAAVGAGPDRPQRKLSRHSTAEAAEAQGHRSTVASCGGS